MEQSNISYYSSNIQNEYIELQTPRIPYNFITNQEEQENENDIKNNNNDEEIEKNKEESKESTYPESILFKTDEETGSKNEQLPTPKIVNVVGMFSIGCPVSLQKIALTCVNSEYNPKRINAVIMRIKEPKTVGLIFSTGVIICAGAKSEVDSEKASRIYAKILKRIGYEVKFKNFRIINIVATCDIKFGLNLTKLNYDLAFKLCLNSKEHKGKKRINYEPEVFPGIIYRMVNPEVTLLIFASGKINFVGAKKRNDSFDALKKIYPFLVNHKVEKIKAKSDEDIKEFNLI